MPKKQRPKTLSLTKKPSSLEFSISCQTGSPWVVGDVPSTHLRHEPQLSIHLRFKLGDSCREILQLGVQRPYEPQLTKMGRQVGARLIFFLIRSSS